LPVPGVANPMTYMWNGEQYIVIAAGGSSEAGTSIADSLMAFRLPRGNEAPSLWSRTVDRPGGRFYAGVVLIAATLFLAVLLAVVARRRWARRALRP
jgi:quinoprotein glucose dehydrogenase